MPFLPFKLPTEKPEGAVFYPGSHWWAPWTHSDKAKGYAASGDASMYDRGVGLRIETPAGEKLFFGIRSGHYYLACRDPVILPDEQLVVFRCGGWILVMDLASRRVGCLVRGDSMVLDASACGPPPEEWLAEE